MSAIKLPFFGQLSLYLAGILILPLVLVSIAKNMLTASAKLKALRDIQPSQIVSVEVYECPGDSIAIMEAQNQKIGGRLLFIATNALDLAKFDNNLKASISSDWNHFGNLHSYAFEIRLTTHSLEFNGIQTKSNPGDIWVSLAGASDAFVPRLHEWIDEKATNVFGN